MKALFQILLFLLLVVHGAFSVCADELAIFSPHWEGYKREFEWRFVEWYQKKYSKSVSIRWVDIGGTSDGLRYILSQKDKAGIDIFFGGGIEPFLELKRSGLLHPVVLSNQEVESIPEKISGSPIYDSDHQWFSTNVAGFGLIYNKRILQLLGVPEPTTWRDMLRPELRGWVSTADPRKSGSVRFVYEALLQYFGWDEGWRIFFGIGNNARTFTAQASQTPKDIALGEIAIGVSIDSYARDLIRSIGDEFVGFVMPNEFKPIVGDGIARLKAAPNPNAADAFIHFALSYEAQQLLVRKVGTKGGPIQYEIGRMGILPEIYQIPAFERISIPNPFENPAPFSYDAAKGAKRWMILTDLIGAAIIDGASNLKAMDRTALPNKPPLTEVEVDELVQEKVWDDLEARDRILNDAYRALYFKRESVPNLVLQNLPIILFLISILGVLILSKRKHCA